MRVTLLRSAIILTSCVAGVASAQENAPVGYRFHHHPRHHAAYCDQPVYCPPPAAPAQPAQQPAEAPVQTPGYYAAPPQAGASGGESNTFGINGFAIHIPAMSLRLPTLELPSLFNLRRGPHMMVDQAVAPFVEQATVAQAAVIPQQTVTPQGAPEKEEDEPEAAPQEAPQPQPCIRPRPCDVLPPPVQRIPSHCPPPTQTGSYPYDRESLERQLDLRDQQISELKEQLSQLTQLTQRLVNAQTPRGKEPAVQPGRVRTAPGYSTNRIPQPPAAMPTARSPQTNPGTSLELIPAPKPQPLGSRQPKITEPSLVE